MSKNLIAYICFGFALMSIAGIFAMPGSIEVSVIYIFLAGLWYQTGASFIKRKKWSWWAALILFTLIAIGNLISVWGTIIAPIFSSSVKGVGFGRWVSLVFLVLSSYLIYLLLQSGTKNEFTTNA
ncbi:hypothetical protein R50072_37780 [Simiduia litorea]